MTSRSRAVLAGRHSEQPPASSMCACAALSDTWELWQGGWSPKEREGTHGVGPPPLGTKVPPPHAAPSLSSTSCPEWWPSPGQQLLWGVPGGQNLRKGLPPPLAAPPDTCSQQYRDPDLPWGLTPSPRGAGRSGEGTSWAIPRRNNTSSLQDAAGAEGGAGVHGEARPQEGGRTGLPSQAPQPGDPHPAGTPVPSSQLRLLQSPASWDNAEGWSERCLAPTGLPCCLSNEQTLRELGLSNGAEEETEAQWGRRSTEGWGVGLQCLLTWSPSWALVGHPCGHCLCVSDGPRAARPACTDRVSREAPLALISVKPPGARLPGGW